MEVLTDATLANGSSSGSIDMFSASRLKEEAEVDLLTGVTSVAFFVFNHGIAKHFMANFAMVCT